LLKKLEKVGYLDLRGMPFTDENLDCILHFALVKQQTGKTLRDHIQERILYEAKTMLAQTDWDINKIGYGLGFSGPAAFTSFFKKKY